MQTRKTMPLDFHRLVLGEGLKAKRLDGTELGFLVVHREMCWNCYGEGLDLDANAEPCQPCNGRGFIETSHSLAMALAAMNLATPAEPDVRWVSYPEAGIHNAGNEYDGVRVFAACPPEATSRQVPYALIVDMQMRNSAPSVASKLFVTVERVMADFFSRYAISAGDVAWFYRNADRGLDRLELNGENRTVDLVPVVSNWDGSDFSVMQLPSFDNRLQLMAEQSASLADLRNE